MREAKRSQMMSDVKFYQRTEPLLVTRFCVSNAWLRKSTYHQGWVRAPEHSWTINDSQQTITKSESASTLKHCAEEGGVMIGFQWKWMSRRNRALGLTNSIGIITQKSPKVNEKIMGFSFQSPRPCHGSVRVSWQLADAGGETSVTQFVVITTDIWGPQLLIWGVMCASHQVNSQDWGMLPPLLDITHIMRPRHKLDTGDFSAPGALSSTFTWLFKWLQATWPRLSSHRVQIFINKALYFSDLLF